MSIPSLLSDPSLRMFDLYDRLSLRIENLNRAVLRADNYGFCNWSVSQALNRV